MPCLFPSTPLCGASTFDDNQLLLLLMPPQQSTGTGRLEETGGDACHHRRPESDRRRLHEIPPIATAGEGSATICVPPSPLLISRMSNPWNEKMDWWCPDCGYLLDAVAFEAFWNVAFACLRYYVNLWLFYDLFYFFVLVEEKL